VPPARLRESVCRVGANLHRPQPHDARESRLSAPALPINLSETLSGQAPRPPRVACAFRTAGLQARAVGHVVGAMGLPTDGNTPRQDCDEHHILSFFLEKAGTLSNAKSSRMCSKGSSGWHETCYFAQKSDRNRVG